MEVNLNFKGLNPFSDIHSNKKDRSHIYYKDNLFSDALVNQVEKQKPIEKEEINAEKIFSDESKKSEEEKIDGHRDNESHHNHLTNEKKSISDKNSEEKEPLVEKKSLAKKESKQLDTKKNQKDDIGDTLLFSLENSENINELIKKLEQFILESSKKGLSPDIKNNLKNILNNLKEQIALVLGGSKDKLGELKLGMKTIQFLENLQATEHLPKELKNQIEKLLNSKRKHRTNTKGVETNIHSSSNNYAIEANKKQTANFFQSIEGQEKSSQRAFKFENIKTENSSTDKNILNNNLNKLYSSQVKEIEPQRILSRLVHQVQSAVMKGNNQVTLKLYPEHLGKIIVHLTKEDGAMAAKLVVDSLAIKELLESKMQDLKDHLNNAGLSFTQVSIDLFNQKKEKKQTQDMMATKNEKKGNKQKEEEIGEVDLLVYRANPNGLLDLIA